MNGNQHYKAHWSKLLIIISVALTTLCVCLTFAAFRHGGMFSWAGWFLLALVFGCALFAIRGYTITPDAILIHRLFWATRLPLASLLSARFEPKAMRWSLRTFGNGGFFSISGWYYNKPLGAYRAFVTDPRRIVVLRYSKRTVVVSPAAPEKFIQDLPIPNPALDFSTQK